MKSVTLLTVPLALLLVAGSTYAGKGEGHRGRHEPDPERRIERMTEELDLSDEQAAQLRAVFEASATEREALREKMEAQFKPEMCALHLATIEQVRDILTDEQEAEMEQRLERLSEFADGKGRRGPRGDFLKDCEPAD